MGCANSKQSGADADDPSAGVDRVDTKFDATKGAADESAKGTPSRGTPSRTASAGMEDDWDAADQTAQTGPDQQKSEVELVKEAEAEMDEAAEAVIKYNVAKKNAKSAARQWEVDKKAAVAALQKAETAVKAAAATKATAVLQAKQAENEANQAGFWDRVFSGESARTAAEKKQAADNAELGWQQADGEKAEAEKNVADATQHAAEAQSAFKFAEAALLGAQGKLTAAKQAKADADAAVENKVEQLGMLQVLKTLQMDKEDFHKALMATIGFFKNKGATRREHLEKYGSVSNCNSCKDLIAEYVTGLGLKELEEATLMDALKGPSAQAPVEEVSGDGPQWANAFSDESNLEKKNKELEVAVGALADSAVKAVKAYLGDFTGLLGLVDTLKTQVETMSWSSEELSERKASVKYDQATGQFALLLIERQSSNKDVKAPFCGAKTYKAKLNYKFKRMEPSNEAARKICQDLVNQQVDGLVEQIAKMNLFGSDGSPKVATRGWGCWG